MSLNPADWEDLQYDSHPFPDYVNYVLGRPTAFQEAFEEQNGDADLNPFPPRQVHIDTFVHETSPYAASSAAQDFSMHPNQQTGRRIGSGGGGAAENPSARNGVRAPQSSSSNSNPASNPNLQHVPPLAPGELLGPEYTWVSDPVRHHYNARITACFQITRNSGEPAERRASAYKLILQISNHVHQQKAVHLAQVARQDLQLRLHQFQNALRARGTLYVGDPRASILDSHMRDALSGMREPYRSQCEQAMQQFHHPGTSTLNSLSVSQPTTSYHMEMYRQRYGNGNNGSLQTPPPQYSSTPAGPSALESEPPKEQSPPFEWLGDSFW